MVKIELTLKNSKNPVDNPRPAKYIFPVCDRKNQLTQVFITDIYLIVNAKNKRPLNYDFVKRTAG